MIRVVLCICLTLTWVVIYSIDVKEDMTVYRKCGQEEQCDTPLAEFEPDGSLLCFTKCLQLASCSHVRFNSKTLVCRICKASNVVQSVKPKNSESDEDWSCRKKPSSVPSSECQLGSTSVKSRSGETKCVHYDQQEHLQKRTRMWTQPRNYSRLLKMTEQDLSDNWTTTTKIKGSGIMMRSLTWSPSFANEFYILSGRLPDFAIKLFMLKGNLLEEQVQWDNVLLSTKSSVVAWTTIDTGRCPTNDSMSCIYVFKMSHFAKGLEMHLRCYREVKSPRHLELEREGEIKHSLQGTAVGCVFSCSGKFGMAIYYYSAWDYGVKRYHIHAGKGDFTLNEFENINGMSFTKHMKWNYDGSFAFAMSDHRISLIRYLDGKEQTVVEVKNKFYVDLALVWTNTSILVFEIGVGHEVLKIRCLKF